DDRAAIRPVPRPRPRCDQPTRPDAERKRADDWKPDVIYDYGDSQVCRFGNGPDKRILQRQPDPAGGYFADLEGVTPHLYRREELLAAPKGSIVIVNEGEKGVEACRARGLLATCSPMGAGKWRDSYAPDLAGLVVIVTADH